MVIDIASGQITNISGTVAGTRNDDPTWSADGTRIAYDKTVNGGTSEIVVQNATAGAPVTQLTSTGTMNVAVLPNEQINPLFEAVVDATEEAILNALLAAETMTGRAAHTAHALEPELLLGALATRA